MSHDKTTIVSRKIDSDGCDHISFHNNGECSEASCGVCNNWKALQPK